jgi:hypothetical protein
VEDKNMFIDTLNTMNDVVLELALADAFKDMRFHEGEEFITGLQNYLLEFDNNTTTEDYDSSFFESIMPYIEYSVMRYGEGLYEGLKSGGFSDPAYSKGEGFVGGEASGILGEKERNSYLSKAGLKIPGTSKKALTESDESAVLESIVPFIYSAAREFVAKVNS